MPIYAVIVGGAFREWREFTVPPAHREGSLLPQSIDPLPAFDPATEAVEEGAPVIEPHQARKTWSVRPLTMLELDARADAAQLETMRRVYSALNAGTGDGAARLARVEKVAAFLLKQHAKVAGVVPE